MAFAFVLLVLVLVLVVTLNRGLFERLGVHGAARLLLVWAVVLAGLALVGRLLGMV